MPAQKPNSASKARQLALRALERIENGSYSNIVISDIISKNDLDEKDRALFSAIVKGVIERRITLDAVISSLSSIPKDRIDTDALLLLRMGIYQLYYMDSVPKYAAVNECVAMARKRSKGYINAILRSFIRSDCSFAYPKDELERISVEYSVPVGMLEKFISIFGKERAEKIFEAFFVRRDTDICVNPLRTSRDALKDAIEKFGYRAESGKLSPWCIKTNAPYSFLESNFAGEFLAMDEASQLCGASLGVSPGDRVLDTCAAPGSKSYLAAFAMRNKGSVLSSDLHSSKLSLVEKGAERLGIDIIKTREADARQIDEELLDSFDCVLCDVPCSGLGVIGGKPEIKYKSIDEMSGLPRIQYDILCTSSKYVKKGGHLIYSTCTLVPEENELNVERFIRENPEFSLEGFTVGNEECGGMITLAPDTHKTDGFFIARMVRKKDL